MRAAGFSNYLRPVVTYHRSFAPSVSSIKLLPGLMETFKQFDSARLRQAGRDFADRVR